MMKKTEIIPISPAIQIVEILSRIYRSGMTTTSGGNISILDEKGNIWITPSGIDKGTLTDAEISCVKKDGTFSGKHKPSSELPFHQAIYELRPDIRAIIHAHPPALTSFSIVRKIPDTSILPNVRNFCQDIGYAAYELPGSEALGQKIATEFRKTSVKSVIMENHAIVIGGKDMEEAYKRLEYLELCSQTIINAIIQGSIKYTNDVAPDDYAGQLKAFEYKLSDIKPGKNDGLFREEIVYFIKRACKQGLMAGSFGDISVRTGKDSFLITPSEKHRWNINVQDIIKIQGEKAESYKKTGIFTRLHQKIYDTNPSINSIIHTQPPYLTAFAASSANLEVRTIPESWIFLQDVPKVPLSSLNADNDIIPEILTDNISVVLISNDSVLATGNKLIHTFDKLEIAEFSANSLIQSKALGKMIPLDKFQIEGLRNKFLS